MTDTLLLDNDLYYVLAATDTLDDFLSILSIEDSSVYILPELKWEVQQHTRKYASEQRERCCTLYTRFQETLLTPQERDVLPFLLQVPDINDGEALLLARLSSVQKGILITKDTRFVSALKKLPPERQSVAYEKIIILEHVLFCLYHKLGHE